MKGQPKPHREILNFLNCGARARIVERFWALVTVAGPDECWEWTGCRGGHGLYGQFTLASGQNRRAHRVAWAIANEREPGDLIVRHACDHPICCNPRHLEIGTPLDNSRDMTERGRWCQRSRRGVDNGASRLTVAQIGEIVAAFRRGEANVAIAARYPVGHALISRIRTGRSWQAEAAQFGWQPAATVVEERAAA